MRIGKAEEDGRSGKVERRRTSGRRKREASGKRAEGNEREPRGARSEVRNRRKRRGEREREASREPGETQESEEAERQRNESEAGRKRERRRAGKQVGPNGNMGLSMRKRERRHAVSTEEEAEEEADPFASRTSVNAAGIIDIGIRVCVVDDDVRLGVRLRLCLCELLDLTAAGGTDDGSYGFKGFVTDALKAEIESGRIYDEVIAIGPLPMMRGICNLTREFGIKTTVSMNTIMIDGTGMCGGCRLTVDGKTKFACVDGPDFDGHLIDFDEVIKRNRMYKEEENAAREKACRFLNL